MGFGITEEMATERLIGSFSAGQKSKLVLAGAFWQKPHMIAMDEPTNYIDMETVDARAKALKNFRGGVMVITHSQSFVESVLGCLGGQGRVPNCKADKWRSRILAEKRKRSGRIHPEKRIHTEIPKGKTRQEKEKMNLEKIAAPARQRRG